MTLTVNTYVRDSDTGEMKLLPVPHEKELAGVEATRSELWGAPIMTMLGLSILPSLKTADVDVSGEKLDDLEKEVNTIRENIPLITQHVRYDESTIQQRSNNILDAIKQAREANGGVIIW